MARAYPASWADRRRRKGNNNNCKFVFQVGMVDPERIRCDWMLVYSTISSMGMPREYSTFKSNAANRKFYLQLDNYDQSALRSVLSHLWSRG